MSRLANEEIRKLRVRKQIRGTSERPRLCVVSTLGHIYAQVIDDSKGVTLAAVSTLTKDAGLSKMAKMEAAKKIGNLIAQKAKTKGVTQVVFDRGSRLYHGRIRALAEAAREAGLKF